jgi:hypothetical protein
MPFLLLAVVLALVSAETFYVVEADAQTTWAWENSSSWTKSDSSAGAVPGPQDDVVFVRTSCAAGKSALGRVLLLQSDVTVQSVTLASFGNCLTSFVVGPTGWLRAQRFTAAAGTRVSLGNGTITAPLLIFEGSSYLAGVGTIAGEVVLGGNSVLFAGERKYCFSLRSH